MSNKATHSILRVPLHTHQPVFCVGSCPVPLASICRLQLFLPPRSCSRPWSTSSAVREEEREVREQHIHTKVTNTHQPVFNTHQPVFCVGFGPVSLASGSSLRPFLPPGSCSHPWSTSSSAVELGRFLNTCYKILVHYLHVLIGLSLSTTLELSEKSSRTTRG